MIRIARDFRLVPIVLLATIALFALKVSGLVFDGGYTLAERLENRNKPSLQIAAPESVPDYPKIVVADDAHLPGASAPKQPWAQEMFNYNDDSDRDITGSVGKEDKANKEDKAVKENKAAKDSDEKLKVSDKPPGPPKVKAAGEEIQIKPGHINSPGERAILESLHDRRQQLETRSHELDMRESLLKAAEKRIEAKVAELKGVETRVKTEMGNRDEAEAKRLKSLIIMYENMKPKDAARIFDRLTMTILVDVSTHMNPRAMSAILAQMTPEAAERLTVELANRASGQPMSQNPNQLPKIEGKPSGS
jgi:flagellar motility protein MotE (MotC chaperone)